jgi:hypothetical protein
VLLLSGGKLMGKVGKTFTIDHELYVWLADHAEKEGKKESYIINAMLTNLKRDYTTWTCSVCGVSNDLKNKSCYTLSDGDFCKGVKA